MLETLEPRSINAGIMCIAVSPDARWVATGSFDGVVRIWDVLSGELVERLKGEQISIRSVAFHPDSEGLISGSEDKTVSYWDIRPMIQAVTAGEQAKGGSRRTLLKQEIATMPNRVPAAGGFFYRIPQPREHGQIDGEMGSVRIALFTGHKARYYPRSLGAI